MGLFSGAERRINQMPGFQSVNPEKKNKQVHVEAAERLQWEPGRSDETSRFHRLDLVFIQGFRRTAARNIHTDFLPNAVWQVDIQPSWTLRTQMLCNLYFSNSGMSINNKLTKRMIFI